MIASTAWVRGVKLRAVTPTTAILALACLLWGIAGSARADDLVELPLARLQEVRSVEGVLQVTLEAREEPVRIGAITLGGSIYNHQYAGPVLRVHPGDVMRIRLINHLSRPTNLHFHGIDTSPRGNSDNMHILVEPGQAFDYEVLIPASQPPGLYWYHDHTHGITRENVMGGLSGALIVEGFREQFEALAGVREQLLVLKDYELAGSDDPYVNKTLHKFVQTINGQALSSVAMAPGETQLWLISNQSADYYFNLRIKDHAVRIIGEDGSAARSETAAERISIKPASTLAVLVTAGAAGTYPLLSEGVPTGDGAGKTRYRVLGHLLVSGAAQVPVPGLTAFPAREDLRDRRIDAERSVHFSQVDAEERYLIDGRTFDHSRVDIRVPLGNIEEWTIFNDTDDFHEFHIHQVSFQVVEVDGEAQPFNGVVNVVRVPERGSVKLRMAFTDPVILGRFMYHCHVLKHEDRGMMANIEVYDPTER